MSIFKTKNHFRAFLLMSSLILTSCLNGPPFAVSKDKYPTTLTEDEKKHPLAVYYHRLAHIPSYTLNGIKAISPDDAVKFEDINRILDPNDSSLENGYVKLKDGTGYVAVNIQFPGTSIKMLDWWFDFVGFEAIRYKIWYPGLHSQAIYKKRLDHEPKTYSLSKAIQNTPNQMVKHTLEAISPSDKKLKNLYIQFVDPSTFGIDKALFKDNQYAIAAIVKNGPIEVAKMVHFVRNTNEGVEMRSRFWQGANLPGFLKAIASSEESMYNMAYHCAQEYNQLASFLPEVYKMYNSENSNK